MDGENHGKPYFLMDDLGGKPTIFGNIHIFPKDLYNHRTSDGEQGVYKCIITSETPRYLGSMKPFSVKVSQDPKGLEFFED